MESSRVYAHPSSPERVIFHRSPLVLLFEYLTLFGIVSSGILFLYLTRNIRHQGIFTSRNSINMLYKACGGILFLEMIRRYYDELFIFGRCRVIHLRGRLSLKLRRTSLSYRDIQEVRVDQTLLGRVLRYGKLSFGTAASEKREIQFNDIPSPGSLLAHAQGLISSAQDANDSSRE